jgi:hypothetical protein
MIEHAHNWEKKLTAVAAAREQRSSMVRFADNSNYAHAAVP